MKTIRLVVGVFLTTLALFGLAGAQTSPKGQLDSSATQQAQLSRAFETFRSRLIVLAGRMETGSAEDRQRARSIRAALKLISEQNTSGRFDALVRSLSSTGADQNLDVLARVVKDNKDLRADLQRIIALLINDGSKALTEKKEAIQKLLDQLKDLRDKQARLQASTEMGKQDGKALARAQDKLAEKTREALEPKDNEKDADKEQREKVRKPVESAASAQGKAGKQLQGGDRDGAGDSQGQAVRDLDEAIRQLENDLAQARQEERKQQLQDLLSRCKKMLQMQAEVRDGTERLDEEIRKSKEDKLTLAQTTRANRLSDKERDIEREGNAALKLVKDDGAAVAFTEVLEQLIKDFGSIVDRLDRSDVGTITQTIENDAVDTLKEMVKALEKSISENENAITA